MRILLIWWFFNSVLLIAQTVIIGKGQTDVFLYPNIINAVSNLILSLILVRFLGVIGIALGTTIPMVITTTFLIRSILKRLGIRVTDYLKKSVLPNLAYYILVLLFAVIGVRFFSSDNIFITIFTTGIIYSVGCLIYFRFFMEHQDRLLVKNLLSLRKSS